MRDRRTERSLSRTDRIDVDPLVIIGRVGEQVDALLRDLQPIGRTELAALGSDELVQPTELLHHFSP